MKIISIKSLISGILLLSVLTSGCQNEKKHSSDHKISKSDSLSVLIEGERLSKVYCATCHVYPEPDLPGEPDHHQW